MTDHKYCYPNSDVLKNKLEIRDAAKLKEAEHNFSQARLLELGHNPIQGNFDFEHLKKIHKYIFQDVYYWAGMIRTVEISKGNSLFCTTQCINDFARDIFYNFYKDCKNASDITDFVDTLADYYGDLNALHPFREGNGRTQREFIRTLCLKCDYILDLSKTSHQEMVEASILSFMKKDNSKFKEIFKIAIIPKSDYKQLHQNDLGQFCLSGEKEETENNYADVDSDVIEKYNEFYREIIDKYSSEKNIRQR